MIETTAVIGYSHVTERIVEELSVCVRYVSVLFFLKKLFLASLDVRDNGIEVVVRAPE